MPPIQTNGHANITLFTVKVVLAEPLANPTNSTVMAVIDILSRIIVPELALFAIVLAHIPPTRLVYTDLPGRLDLHAVHAHHRHRQASGDVVVRDFIMAESASVPLSTAVGLEFGCSLVVLAAEDRFLLVLHNVL